MNISDFDFSFPAGLVARYPSEIRGESKLLIAHRKTQEIYHTSFSKICDFLEQGDCLVVNQSRVFPARLFGQKETGGKVELLLLENISENRWKCLAFPLKRLRTGVKIFFPLDHSEPNCHSEPKARNLLSAAVIEVQEAHVVIDFNTEGVPPAGEFQKMIEKIGHIPLPPYLGRKAEPIDRERYQTIFANQMGAVAAPTAGLHWTEGLIREVSEYGIEVVPITLHVGQGTFAVIREEQIQNHKMHAEYVEISEEAVQKINAAKRVVAVGTTVVRALESAAKNGEVNAMQGKTDLYIYPSKLGYRFQIVDVLQTNFHRPRSSLYVMVSAFAGLGFIRRCYEDALGRGYRLFSYGDTMLIL